MSKVVVVDHPLVQHKLTLMRDKDCGNKDFRQLLEEITMLMGYEVTRDLPMKEIEIETPIKKCKSKIIAGKKLGIVPILRAGLGMVDLMREFQAEVVGVCVMTTTARPAEKRVKNVRSLLILEGFDPVTGCANIHPADEFR